ncbi:MAG: trypsin-like serine protease [Saprospiraceae bacterium]|nr:trypsin-like serine protease [Saprospiraceae bacterium]
MKVKPLNIVLGIILLASGFFVGTAWKTSEDNDTTTTATTTSVRTQTPIPLNTAATGTFNKEESATIRLFEGAAPSVVFITTSVVQRNIFTMDATEIPSGTGSGFVWDKEGHIITNFHVIQGADRAQVTFADQTTWDAKVVGAAPEKDLAVLKIDIDANQLKPIPIGNSDNLRVGQFAYAIGNPFGLDQTLTTGIVSALGREIESVGGVTIKDVIQTDAAINPGNSGGPLLNSSGELIGVNTAIYSPSGAYAGIGFSIPVDAVKRAVPDLIQFGRINRPTLGIYPARQGGLQLEGVLVMEVSEGSAAAKAGLRPTLRDRYGRIILGDIIVGINNDKIKSYSDLILTLEKYKPGQQVVVKLLREEKEVELKVVLDAGI